MKGRSVSLRVSDEVYDVLERIQNKSEYITHLLLRDFAQGSNNFLQKIARKEAAKERSTKSMQISNSSRKLRSICFGKSTEEKQMLKEAFVELLNAEKEIQEDQKIKSQIEFKLKEINEIDFFGELTNASTKYKQDNTTEPRRIARNIRREP